LVEQDGPAPTGPSYFLFPNLLAHRFLSAENGLDAKQICIQQFLSSAHLRRRLPFRCGRIESAALFDLAKNCRLGGTLRLTCPAEAASAKWNGRTVRLFRQPDGKSFGLMPVSVKDSPGPASIEFSFQRRTAFRHGKIPRSRHPFPSENVRLSPDIEALRSTPEELQLLTTFRNEVTDDRFWQDPLAPPIDGCVTSPFGVKRMHNGKPTGEFHGGVDQRTPAGEEIRAIADGKIIFAKKFNVLGNAVGIDHGQGLGSMYLHMSKLAVADGALVKKGDALGYRRIHRRSTGPHLHWVLYANGVNINPAQWLKLTACPRPPKQK